MAEIPKAPPLEIDVFPCYLFHMTEHREKRLARMQLRAHETGGLLLDYLTSRFTYNNRERWQDMIYEGCLCVNSKTASIRARVKPGDLVEFHMPDAQEPPVQARYGILYRDDTLVVVDKPGDLPSHPGGRYFRNTLWWLLRTRFGDEHLSLVNRLDRETSGIVLIARSKWAAGELGRQFKGRTVRKKYVVLVEGRFPKRPMEAAGILVRDRESLVRKRRRFIPGAPCLPPGVQWERCSTTLRLAAFSNGLSLVEAIPHTGRLHQIRATLCGLGYPVVGDKIYGLDDRLFLRYIEGRLTREDEQKLRLPRQAVHAAGLRFHHPAAGAALSFNSPIPKEIKALLNTLAPSFFNNFR